MTITAEHIITFGPDTVICGYTIGGKDEHKIGDNIKGRVVVAKLQYGDLMCADRRISMCTLCMNANWAAKKECKIPLLEKES